MCVLDEVDPLYSVGIMCVLSSRIGHHNTTSIALAACLHTHVHQHHMGKRKCRLEDSTNSIALS